MMAKTPQRKQFVNACTRVINDWSPAAFARLGGTIQRALIADALMAVLAAQDESMDPAAFRHLFEDLYLELMGLDS